jgi:alpha-N-arabinofuranosidase
MITTLKLHPRFNTGPVSPLLFGGFLEHMGRCVYEGVFDPTSLHADQHGFRRDVMDALRALEMTIMRYPGGNFVSDYHWQDGIGPQSERPVVKNLAWQSLESNQFGTDEYMRLCGVMGWEPMIAVNLGTGTPEEARNWVEYCNSEATTRYARMRADNGVESPYGVKYWCLGNEMDGPWQTGHVPAEHYAIRAQQAAQMMKGCDRDIEMVVCGSSAVEMPTYLDWDRTALERIGSLGRYVSLHRYMRNDNDDTQEYLAAGRSIDEQIESVDAVCRYVQARRGSRRRAYLCFDEWNVWYKARSQADMNGKDQFAPHLVEEVYNLEDALVVAQFLNSFVRHADVVKIANLAQVVNVIAPLLTRADELLKQSIYFVFQLFSEKKEGVALQISVDGPSYATQRYADVGLLDCSAILNRRDRELSLFCVNRSPNEALDLEADLTDLGVTSIIDGQIIHHADLKAANSFEHPDRVVPERFDDLSVDSGVAIGQLPPAAFVRLVFRLKE